MSIKEIVKNKNDIPNPKVKKIKKEKERLYRWRVY